LLELKESPWEENTEDYVNHRLVLEYIRSFARNNGVEKLVKYNTRVERVEKQGSKWVLSTSTLVKEGADRGRLEYDTEVSDENNKVSRVLTWPGI
jgi:cation diffusion facilitator CzcD-associated flavoprotein CzcO